MRKNNQRDYQDETRMKRALLSALPSGSPTSSWVLIFSMLLSILMTRPVHGELSIHSPQHQSRDTAETICACSPATYTFRLDFGLDACDSPKIQDQSFVENVTCSFAPSMANRPERVSLIEITELGQDGSPVSSDSAEGNFPDGTSFTYISHLNNANLSQTELPKSIIGLLIGVTSSGEQVVNEWSVSFTNECGASFPVLQAGDQIGWLEITGTTLSSRYCPGVAPTPTPTVTPTVAPTVKRCACTPSIYTFQLDLQAACPGNIGISDGIAQTLCLIEKRSNRLDRNNLVPVLVMSIQILELNENFDVIVQENFPMSDYADGFVFQYESITSTNDTLSNENIPLSLQLILSGLNSEGQEVVNSIVIAFTNDCQAFPVLEGDGQEQIGWTNVVNVTSARSIYCPAVATGAPTASPVIETLSPVISPSVSLAPSEFPSEAPSECREAKSIKRKTKSPKKEYGKRQRRTERKQQAQLTHSQKRLLLLDSTTHSREEDGLSYQLHYSMRRRTKEDKKTQNKPMGSRNNMQYEPKQIMDGDEEEYYESRSRMMKVKKKSAKKSSSSPPSRCDDSVYY
eukprot:CAMPEP_0172458958 /NCGR_PEP_ID=MMETSP1065-20121228/30259_1 /TAXON_ID=265537 /ORGANISM="Amphiprora paludosa, Strain CCMP125" /LENGTH=571 /DNA_ID=CAMNT_0013213461 /DNA_START=118 /DNA_END=1833 /DNA_ORIENTATION=-